MRTLIHNATLVNEGRVFSGHLIIEGDIIADILESGNPADIAADHRIDATGLHVLPGAIDDQVHFRQPGLTHKADIATESRAAVAGGITSFMEMPNTVPQSLTQELLEEKYQIAARDSVANYSFFMGASNDNLDEVLRTDPRTVCGVKVFMGSSTGNMLVDSREVLENLFSRCPMLIATHCEDEPTIRENMAKARETYGEDVPIEQHPVIRSEEACYRSSSMAVALARKYNTRLHILHISTARETALFDHHLPLEEKRITSEACVHHLWFTQEQYAEKGTFIKWNPAVKRKEDREAIWAALLDNRIDIVATDHAPHTREEKNNSYFNAPSGGPMVQHALVAMLEAMHQGRITLDRVVEKMSHAPAVCFQLENRGFLRKGYYADLALVRLNDPWTVTPESLLYKCGWSPMEGETFRSRIIHTFVNGKVAYSNTNGQAVGTVLEEHRGQRLLFQR